MKLFTRYKKLFSSLILFVFLSGPVLSLRAQKNTVSRDTTRTEIQKEAFPDKTSAELEQPEETKSDISSYTFVFYLIYKFISSFTTQTDR